MGTETVMETADGDRDGDGDGDTDLEGDGQPEILVACLRLGLYMITTNSFPSLVGTTDESQGKVAGRLARRGRAALLPEAVTACAALL